MRKETRGKEWKGAEIVQESFRVRGISERKGGEIKKEDGGDKKKGKGRGNRKEGGKEKGGKERSR